MSISILTPSSNDLAVQLLSKILGSGWQNWATGGSASGAGGVLGAMFDALNVALMTLAGAVLVYTHATGTADMARTGQSKVNTWTFLRQALAMMLLAPVPWANGLNILQVLVMLATSWSIGLADNVWTTAVQYVAAHGGSVQPANAITPLSDDVLAGLVKTGVIAASLGQSRSLETGYNVSSFSQPVYEPQEYIGVGALPAGSSMSGSAGQGPQVGVVFGYQATGAGTIPPAAFGMVNVRCKPALCAAVGRGLQAVALDLQPAVAAAMSWTASGQDGTPIPAGLFDKARADYSAAVQAAIAADANAQGQSLSQALQTFQNSAADQGWAAAGTYFYQLSNFNAEASANDVSISYEPPNLQELNGALPNTAGTALTVVDQYAASERDNAFGGANMLAAAGANAAPGGRCPSWSDGAWTAMTCYLSTPLLYTNSAVINAMTGGGVSGALGATGVDAIAGIQSASNAGLDALELIGGAYVGAKTAAAAADEGARQTAAEGRSVPLIGALTGAPGSIGATVAAGAKAAIEGIAPWVWTVVFGGVALMAIGAYYLPLLPAIIFALGVIGWLILVLEMLVAAPLWAFSHVLPEGDGLLGSSARTGYFHMLDILARPVLLVFGFFLTILVMNVAVWFVGEGLQIAFASALQGKSVGLMSAIAELVILMGAIYLVTNRTVHLIATVPRTVMRWMGQAMGVEGGEIEGERSTNALVAARLGGGARNVGGGLSGASQAARNESKQAARDEARTARDVKNAADSEAQSHQTPQAPTVSPSASNGLQE